MTNSNKYNKSKNNCNFWVDIKKIINGQESNIKKKYLFFFKKNKTKINKVNKFNWDPKLSDFKKADRTNNISVLEKIENSKSRWILIFDNPSKYIVDATFWW